MLGLKPGLALAPAEAPESSYLDDCYRHCRDIARSNSKTFYLSSLFLSPEKRRAVWAVYAFCRTADDIVDQVTPATERLAAIDYWERALLAAYNGSPKDRIMVALYDAIRRFDIPLQPALDLLRGARLDITVRRYATYDDLREYCYLVASTVGLLTSPILGYTSDAALDYGVALGRAMQMTNILRDVGEDARMGRIYLPLDEMQQFGYTESSLFEEVVDGAFVALMKFQIDRVRRLYAEAEPGIAMLAPESRYTVRLALTLYRQILRSIEDNRYDVYSKRAYVPFRSKMLAAMTVAFIR
ncbi:MAG: squalene/phytoene synthase family protein [Candidatus Velthaea sp.]